MLGSTPMTFRQGRATMATILAAVAIAEIAALALIAGGVDRPLTIGPIRIGLQNYEQPFWIGTAAATALLIAGWRSRVYQWLACGLLSALTIALICALARSAPEITTKADIAITELYVQIALKGELLVGPYSRFQWHHPGPLYFWLQAPVYALSGYRGVGLYAGALAINLVALIVLVWTLIRVNTGASSVFILGACLLLAWRDRWILASPWTAHIPVFATITFLVLVAASVSGSRWFLLGVVAFGSVIVQTHLALVPVVLVLSLVALAGVILNEGRLPGGRLRRTLNTSAWLLALLWLLPIAEQLSHTPGNIVRLWDFFVADPQPVQPFWTSFQSWSYALVGVLRPDLYTPTGGHFRLTHVGWGVPAALVEVILLLVVAQRDRRAGRPFDSWMAFIAATTSLVGLWSITRIRGDILDHEIFWLSAVGAVNLAVLSAATFRAGYARWRGPLEVDHRLLTVLSAILVVALTGVGLRDFGRLVSFERSSRRDDEMLAATYEAIRGHLSIGGIRKPIFRVEGIWDVAAATFVRLERAGIPFALDDEWEYMFTDAFRADGTEDAAVTIGGLERHRLLLGQPGNVTVFERAPVYVDIRKTTSPVIPDR